MMCTSTKTPRYRFLPRDMVDWSITKHNERINRCCVDVFAEPVTLLREHIVYVFWYIKWILDSHDWYILQIKCTRKTSCSQWLIKCMGQSRELWHDINCISLYLQIDPPVREGQGHTIRCTRSSWSQASACSCYSPPSSTHHLPLPPLI